MRLKPTIQQSVVFIGYAASKEEGGIRAIGTAFLFSHEGYGYLVTAQHIAVDIGDNPFVLRFNRSGGGSHVFQVDPIEHGIKWASHPDPNVDLAVLPFHVDLAEHKLEHHFLPSDWVVREDSVPADFGVGDPCYAVGLFRLLIGSKHNLAVVHSGNLALLGGREPVPVQDWLEHPSSGKTRLIRAHLVGLNSLEGLSGSPVFVRPPLAIENIRAAVGNSRAFVSQEDVKILGVWQGSWRGESLAVANAVNGRARASFGMGVVTPIGYLMEILEKEEMAEVRRRHFSSDVAPRKPQAD